MRLSLRRLGAASFRFAVFAFFAVLILFVCLACVSGAGEETLLRYAKARSLYFQGRFEEALENLNNSMENFIPGLTLRGKAEYFSGDAENAERTFRLALKKRPSASEAALYLARVLREGERPDEARALVEALIADDPLDVRALRLAAGLEGDRGQDGQALAFLDRAAEAAAEYAMVFIDRARLRWIAGKGEETLEDLGRARALLPADTPILRAVERLETAVREAR
jgi:tetratricopeptide (TPR) repeat protein